MNLQTMADSMDKAIDHFEDSIHGIRSAGITTAFIDSFKVQYYGQLTPIKVIAFTSSDKGRILVKAYDPTVAPTIKQALVSAGLNAYTLSKDTVVVSVPPMSGEEKTRTITRLNKLGEEAKISIRNIRKSYRNSLPKAVLERTDKRIQETTDKAIDTVDDLVNKKIAAL